MKLNVSDIKIGSLISWKGFNGKEITGEVVEFSGERFDVKNGIVVQSVMVKTDDVIYGTAVLLDGKEVIEVVNE